MKKFSVLALLLFASVSLSSCRVVIVKDKSALNRETIQPSENIVDSLYTLAPFDAVKVSGAGKVFFTQGQEFLKVSAPDNLIDKISVRVEGSTLVIKPEVNSAGRLDDCLVYTLCCPSLEEITVSGSVDFISENVLSCSSLSVAASGSSDVDLRGLDCSGDAEFSLSGSSDLKGFGLKARSFDVSLSGSCDMDVDGLVAERVDVSGSGSTDVELKNLEVKKMDVALSGSGDICLTGKADEVYFKLSGSADADIRDLEYKDASWSTSGSSTVKGARK